MSIRIDLDRAIPCAFNRGGRMKFGLKMEDKFVWVTQTIDREDGIKTQCIHVENPVGLIILQMGSSEEELEKIGLQGFSLRVAKAWTMED